MLPPAPTLAFPDPSPTDIGGGIIQVARYQDIARRVLMGQSTKEIASDLDLSDRQVRRLLLDPKMIEVYTQVHAEFYADLDKIISDEKIQPLRRAHAQAIRAQTVVSEIIDEIRKRIAEGRAKATDLKVGADTAFGIIDRAKGQLSNSPQAGTAVHVEFNLSSDKRNLLRDTIKEAGLDLSDLGIIDVVPVQEASDAPSDPTNDCP